MIKTQGRNQKEFLLVFLELVIVLLLLINFFGFGSGRFIFAAEDDDDDDFFNNPFITQAECFEMGDDCLFGSKGAIPATGYRGDWDCNGPPSCKKYERFDGQKACYNDPACTYDDDGDFIARVRVKKEAPAKGTKEAFSGPSAPIGAALQSPNLPRNPLSSSGFPPTAASPFSASPFDDEKEEEGATSLVSEKIYEFLLTEKDTVEVYCLIPK